jgi:hypothetical protein
MAANGAGAQLGEYQVKAAYLYNFVKFVQWAPGDRPIVIAVVGRDPFETMIDDVVRGRVVGGRPIVVKRLRPRDDVSTCDVLFVSASEAERTPEILRQVSGAPILTIGETDSFLKDGGMVRFFHEEDKVRFQINVVAVDRGRLKMHSQLLSLAAK